MRWLGIAGILAYRAFVRPFVRRTCLHEESCSAFAIRMLREKGYSRAVPFIQQRVRLCRMPMMACYVLDANGAARLLSATSHDGSPMTAKAVALLAQRAEFRVMTGYGMGE